MAGWGEEGTPNSDRSPWNGSTCQTDYDNGIIISEVEFGVSNQRLEIGWGSTLVCEAAILAMNLYMVATMQWDTLCGDWNKTSLICHLHRLVHFFLQFCNCVTCKKGDTGEKAGPSPKHDLLVYLLHLYQMLYQKKKCGADSQRSFSFLMASFSSSVVFKVGGRKWDMTMRNCSKPISSQEPTSSWCWFLSHKQKKSTFRHCALKLNKMGDSDVCK